MKDGLYEFVDDDRTNYGHIVIDVKEKEKSYIFQLIENTCRFDPFRISSLFNKSDKAKINKNKSKHAIMDFGDSFTIYPYRDGIPYYFRLQNTERCKNMKEITVQDCLDLQKRFKEYCNIAEQHQFALLTMIDIRMENTIKHIVEAGKIENQKDMRAMFRVVLKTMGEDFSEYEDCN